jgi:dihydropteroate synthase
LDSSNPVLRVGTKTFRFGQPLVMGIVNVTTDSFSGDGLGKDRQAAIRRGLDMLASGATFVDVGGESTRPGADPISLEEELKRTTEVIKELAGRHPGRVSIDTTKAVVAEAALKAGASIVNDVNGLRGPRMTEVVADHDASVVIMHMLGTPGTMQKAPRYRDVVEDIAEFLAERISETEEAGVSPNRIMIDPGIGFGKTLRHNLEIIARLREFRSLGKTIVVGASRKSFIGKVTGKEAEDRLPGSIAAAVLAAQNGASILRVHDVPETHQALQIYWRVAQKG